jgi:integrase
MDFSILPRSRAPKPGTATASKASIRRRNGRQGRRDPSIDFPILPRSHAPEPGPRQRRRPRFAGEMGGRGGEILRSIFRSCLARTRRSKGRCLTTRQYARLLSRWIASIGLDPSSFGTHSLRRTKGTLIYRRTGNLRAVQLLLGHTKVESTVRYLGIEVDDALAIAEQIDV